MMLLFCESCSTGRLLFAFLYFVISFSGTLGQDVFSCGGFIKSTVAIDFGRVWVKLYTPEGNLKYETDCAPNNGYYMIPVYSKGLFVIKVHPPDGWKFEPESMEIKVDGETDQCSKGEDINFNFKGFRITGKVITSVSATGPTDFTVRLLSSDSSSFIKETQTTEGGVYTFDGVFPGHYSVSASEDQMCSSGTSVKASLTTDVLKMSSDLEISGYSLSGEVTDKGQAVTGVYLILFSQNDIKLGHCDLSTIPKQFVSPSELKKYHSLCSSKSKEDGSFVFACVPPGKYFVVPFYESQGVKFDVVPKLSSIIVKNLPARFEKSFKVSGFSVTGKVLLKPKGMGVAGANVRVNGKDSTKTSEQGLFLLEQIESGKYTIEIRIDDIEFPVLEVELSPKNPVLPYIYAEKFNLCGDVVFEHFPESVPKLTQRRLLLTSVVNKNNVISITTDQSGHFCRMVERGGYSLAPQLLPNEKEAGLSLVPSVMDITLDDGPVKNIIFTQFEARMSGQIQCLKPCKTVEIKLYNSNKQLVKSTLLNTKQQLHHFELSGLLPAKYTVQVSAENFCWEKNEQSVTIGLSDIGGINFRQTGFGVQVISTNEAKLKWKFSGNDVVSGEEKLKKEINWFCVPVSGKYQFLLESCHKFQRDKYEYNTDIPEPLSLFAVKHLISGTVKMPQKSQHLALRIQSEKKPDEDSIVELKLVTVGEENKSTFVYNYEHFGESGDQLTLMPVSGLFLFSPDKRILQLKDDCIMNIEPFVGEKGIFLEGQITPSIEGVSITMQHPKDRSMVFSAISDYKGSYSIGPLRTYDGFEFTAEKEGYLLTAVGKPGHFQAYKLSEVTIKVFDSDKNPLAGVLISLSGGQEYRSNNLTQDSGLITFVGLSPGDYFVRPILKEYSFHPPTKMVSVKEGSTEIVDLIGTRVAYSCVGQVRHLGGQSVGQVTVEAVSEGCNQLHEEDVTDEDGMYRIRALKPDCNYELKIKTDSQSAAGTYPDWYNVQMDRNDVTGKDFVLRPVWTTMEVAGRVVSDRQWLSSLKIAIYRDDQPDIAVYSVTMQQASMFFVQNIAIDGTLYVARLETSLSQSQFEKWDLPEISFRANESFRYLKFEFWPKKKPVEVEISKASYVALPLALLIVGLVYNHVKVVPVVVDFGQRTFDFITNVTQRQRRPSNGTPGAVAPSLTEFETGDFLSTATRKRLKPRKI